MKYDAKVYMVSEDKVTSEEENSCDTNFIQGLATLNVLEILNALQVE